MTQNMESLLSPLGILLILLGALRGTEGAAGVFAFAALLILAVTTYPPADARRGAEAALVLASAIGLFVLGSLLDEIKAGRAQALNDLVVLIGAALVAADAAGQLLGDAESDGIRRATAPPETERTVAAGGRHAGFSPRG